MSSLAGGMTLNIYFGRVTDVPLNRVLPRGDVTGILEVTSRAVRRRLESDISSVPSDGCPSKYLKLGISGGSQSDPHTHLLLITGVFSSAPLLRSIL